jgi:hypothetical protein
MLDEQVDYILVHMRTKCREVLGFTELGNDVRITHSSYFNLDKPTSLWLY